MIFPLIHFMHSFMDLSYLYFGSKQLKPQLYFIL